MSTVVDIDIMVAHRRRARIRVAGHIREQHGTITVECIHAQTGEPLEEISIAQILTRRMIEDIILETLELEEEYRMPHYAVHLTVRNTHLCKILLRAQEIRKYPDLLMIEVLHEQEWHPAADITLSDLLDAADLCAIEEAILQASVDDDRNDLHHPHAYRAAAN